MPGLHTTFQARSSETLTSLLLHRRPPPAPPSRVFCIQALSTKGDGVIFSRCQAINFFNRINRAINFFNRPLITVLMHFLLVTFFLYVCVPFAGRRRRPIAVECYSTPSTDD